jgi:hypothetical protein
VDEMLMLSPLLALMPIGCEPPLSANFVGTDGAKYIEAVQESRRTEILLSSGEAANLIEELRLDDGEPPFPYQYLSK